MKTKSIAMLAIMLCMASLVNAQTGEWTTIRNGQLWMTPDGESVQAHAPGFIFENGRWYMVGEDRSHTWNPDVNLYSSTDLQNWTFERKIIENGVTDERLGRSRMIERAKLMHNPVTGKYVVWCHWESRNYGASEAACFECDSVNGAYQLVWSGRPMGIKSRDCNIFVDTNGLAYFISTTEENQHLGLFTLAEDYLSPAYSNDLHSGWSELINVGDELAYRTQAAAVLEIKGTKQTTYLYVGDRWMDPTLPESKTIIFPISFKDTECEFHYCDQFEINFTTGEWRKL